MLETLLNLLWLIITLAALWVWRFRWFVSRRNPRARLLPEAVAIGCALALLFPAISLTDDLHPEIVAVDAATGKRGSYLLVAGMTHTAHAATMSGAHLPFALLPSPLARVELSVARIVLTTENLHAFSLFGICTGRSPPPLQ